MPYRRCRDLESTYGTTRLAPIIASVGPLRTTWAGLLALATLIGSIALPLAQSDVAPQNDAPNPFLTIAGWATLPPSRE